MFEIFLNCVSCIDLHWFSKLTMARLECKHFTHRFIWTVPLYRNIVLSRQAILRFVSPQPSSNCSFNAHRTRPKSVTRRCVVTKRPLGLLESRSRHTICAQIADGLDIYINICSKTYGSGNVLWSKFQVRRLSGLSVIVEEDIILLVYNRRGQLIACQTYTDVVFVTS